MKSPNGYRIGQNRRSSGECRLRRSLGWILPLGLTLFLAACQAATVERQAAPAPELERAGGSDGVLVQVTSNGWHSGIVVKRSDLRAGVLPEVADFRDAAYLSFGWGDAEFYPAPSPSMGMALRAAFTSSPAVVHLAGLASPPRQAFPKNETVDVRLSGQGFGNLLAYLDSSFERGGQARAASVAPGLYRTSRFYPATGAFTMFNTCNTWSAKALAAAGRDIEVSGTTSAEELMSQLR